MSETTTNAQVIVQLMKKLFARYKPTIVASIMNLYPEPDKRFWLATRDTATLDDIIQEAHPKHDIYLASPYKEYIQKHTR